MEQLPQLRQKIDEIDREIVRLYEQRMEVAEKVADYKRSVGRAVLDKERESQKIAAVKSLASTQFNAQGVEALFGQLMSISRMRQYTLIAQTQKEPFGFTENPQTTSKDSKVVFAGVKGAYGQQAMEGYFGTEIDSFDVPTFKEAVAAVSSGQAEYGVLPIENSSTGSITDVYDLLSANDNYIVGEYILNIEHALLGYPGAKIEDIRTVYSHPQGLLQCRKFLGSHDWKSISLENTAIAAKKVLDDKDVTQAAVASIRAARYYGLEILAEKINDINNNATRFIIIKHAKQYKKNSDKISICFELPHKTGSLYHILAHFIFNGLNMSSIESRPIRGMKWQYRFFIDVEGNLADPAVINALTGVMAETEKFRILGNYLSAKQTDAQYVKSV